MKYFNKFLLIRNIGFGFQMDDFSNKIANTFYNAGLRKGDAVALMMDNSPEFVCTWLGLSKIGVVTALINTNLRQTSLAHCVNISKCSAFIFELQMLNGNCNILSKRIFLRKILIMAKDERHLERWNLRCRSCSGVKY